MKTKKLLHILLLFLGIATVSYFIWAEKTLYSTQSPEGKYYVTFTHKRHPIALQWGKVYLYASRENVQLIDREYIYATDFLEPTFEAYFPNNTWLAPNILTIGQNWQKDELEGKISIVNNGKENIEYIFLENEEDKFLIFDLKPQSMIDLKFHPSTYMSVQWGISGITKTFGDGIFLKGHPDIPNDTQFNIKIKREKIDFEVPGYDLETGICCGFKRR